MFLFLVLGWVLVLHMSLPALISVPSPFSHFLGKQVSIEPLLEGMKNVMWKQSNAFKCVGDRPSFVLIEAAIYCESKGASKTHACMHAHAQRFLSGLELETNRFGVGESCIWVKNFDIDGLDLPWQCEVGDL